MSDTTFTLARTNQCRSCPWKVCTNPAVDIPHYSREMHEKLEGCIAKDLNYSPPGGMLKVMSCHYSGDECGEEEYCIGWLYNQLGAGNNIPLRLQMLRCQNASKIRVHGPQHLTFQDTLKMPADKKCNS